MRSHLQKTTTLALPLLLTISCVTYDSSLRTARVVAHKTQETTHGVHLLVDHKENVANKRLRGQLSTDLQRASVHTGYSYTMAYGVLERADIALSLSLGVSSLKFRSMLYDSESLAVSFGPSILVPTFSFDALETFASGLTLYSSYDFDDTYSLYLHPQLLLRPSSGSTRSYGGFSLGLAVNLKLKVFVEYSLTRENSRHEDRSLEQLKIGISTF